MKGVVVVKNKCMSNQPVIVRDSAVLLGKPIIAGTRITVELILCKLADGFSVEDILAMYPHFKREQVLAALNYAADLIAHEEVLRGYYCR